MTIEAAGYQDLREHVAATWTHIGIREGAVEHFRLPLTDARVTLESDGTANPVTFRVELAGSDAEISGAMPLTVDNTALHKVAEAGDILDTDSFAPFTFSDAEDSLTIRHHVEGPPIE
jgi:hypothetical protein